MEYQRSGTSCNKCLGNKINGIELDTFICFRKRTVNSGRKVVGNLNGANISKLVRGLTKQCAVMELCGQKDVRKCTRHKDEFVADVKWTCSGDSLITENKEKNGGWGEQRRRGLKYNGRPLWSRCVS
jgi:hypothetical protein